MLGVVGRACTTGEREIIASALTLGTKLLRGRPDQRMKPIHRACQTPQCVSDEIVTANVCKLVEQDSATAIERPRVAFRGKNDRRVEHTAGERHLRIFAAKESRR